MSTIYINKDKKHSVISVFIDHLSFFGLLCFSFFFNFKFLEGNNFLDFLIFLFVILYFLNLGAKAKNKYYFNVKDADIKKIEKILNNN